MKELKYSYWNLLATVKRTDGSVKNIKVPLSLLDENNLPDEFMAFCHIMNKYYPELLDACAHNSTQEEWLEAIRVFGYDPIYDEMEKEVRKIRRERNK